MSQPTDKAYSAFISYSHSDREIAEWFHRSLERFAIPRPLRKTRRSLAPVFMDRAELASSADLTNSVKEALHRSGALIVVCSPRSAASRWVNEEIRFFKLAGRADRIFCLIVAGEPSQDAKPEHSCYPASLKFELNDDGTVSSRPAPTPLGADIRPSRDKRNDALLKLIAGVMAVPFDVLKRRAQARRRRVAIFFVTATAGTVGSISFSFYQQRQARVEAESARRDEQRALAARQQEIQRVNRQLRIADPDNLRGFLESKSRLEDMLSLERAETLDPTTLATVGDLYMKLGSFTVGLNKSIEAEQQFRQKVGASLTDQVMMTTILGQIRLARGEYTEAIRSFRKAVVLSSAPELVSTASHSWALAGLGNALLEADQFQEAEARLKDAQSLDTQLDGAISANVARDISLRATNFYYHGDLALAEQLFTQSIEMRRTTLPPGHVKIAEDLNALGSIFFMRQDHTRAEKLYSEALQSYRRYYGEDHPDTTVLKHNLGRTKLERGAFQDAMELILAGLKASQSELVADHEGLTFTYDSLGLAQMGLGRTAEAEISFRRALDVANKHQPHRMQGPILVDLADLMCRTRRYQDGLNLIEQSRPFIARDYADQAWRTAVADSVEGGCMIGNGQLKKGRQQVQDAYRSLRQLIGSARLFTRDAARRAGT